MYHAPCSLWPLPSVNAGAVTEAVYYITFAE